MSVSFQPRFQTNEDAASYAAARFGVKTRTHRQRKVALIHLNTTITPTHTSTLAPLATQHFVQETFLLGGPMRKVLSICHQFSDTSLTSEATFGARRRAAQNPPVKASEDATESGRTAPSIW